MTYAILIYITLASIIFCIFCGFFIKLLVSFKIMKLKYSQLEDELKINLQNIKDMEMSKKSLETEYEKRYKDLGHKNSKLDEAQKILEEKIEIQNQLITVFDEKNKAAIKLLENYSGFTKEEAKRHLMLTLEEELKINKANLIRRYENEARNEAANRANYVIAQATTRFAGNFAIDRLITNIYLDNDEIKGKIIGKDGRNIKSLQGILGIDIIVNNTPKVIILSSFNIYRRAIAKRTIEMLIQDSRINPAKIEEFHSIIKNQIEEEIYTEGKQVLLDLGIGEMHPDLVRLVGRLRYRASFGQNALSHSIEVAKLAGTIAQELGGDLKIARRVGILHDIGKALTDDAGGCHVDLGVKICKKYKEDEKVLNAILAHHGHEEPRSIECCAVCTADALSAARPGARSEVLETYIQRVEEIEKIALSKYGVQDAYALQSGREIRVIAKHNLISDSECTLLSKEIADEIKSNLSYPGEIKVVVIREVRQIAHA